MILTVGSISLNSNVLLAPLAGITDLPFRRLVSRFGAGLVVSEMVASQEMVQNRPSTRAKAEVHGDLGTASVQIAGREAYWMAECAKLVVDRGARIVDINMGCPAKQVTNGASGSALMRDPDHALSLIEAVVKAVDVPVTLKTRLGWNDDLLNAPEIARRARDAGVQMVTIHGRTRCQFYKGRADWEAIRGVVEAVPDIPVIANGDILGTADAKTALEQSGAAGVMIGRGAQGRPWLISEVAQGIHNACTKRAQSVHQDFNHEALCDLVLEHYDAMLSFYGTAHGLKCARKHLGWYLDQLPAPSPLRRAILTAPSPEAARPLLREAFSMTHEDQAA